MPPAPNVRDVARMHAEELRGITDEQRLHRRMVELNVIEQCPGPQGDGGGLVGAPGGFEKPRPRDFPELQKASPQTLMSFLSSGVSPLPR